MPIDKSLKILVISSADPTIGPGVVGLEHFNALKRGGFDVDFLTKYPVKGHPEFISVIDEKPKAATFLEKLYKLVKHRITRLIHPQKANYWFFYRKEDCPPVPVKHVLDKINRQYDVVYILFWQELLSFATIDALYDKLHCQIQFRCVDYSPMSGGCHFTGDCMNYQTGCGHCPGIYSHRKNDFTRWNVQYRKKIYEKVKPVVYGNSYMHSFYHQSFLLKDYDRLEVILPTMDNEYYKPLDMMAYRQKYQIPTNKRFVVFFGCQSLNDERKGFSYLIDALRILHDHLTESEREEILLVIAGRNIDQIKDQLCFDYKYLGYVASSELPGIYSMASVYLSPSVNDAGPSMVNQSMSCGTPVVAFEMGTALDVIKDRGTGFCAKLRDAEDFAKGIESIFYLSESDYLSLRRKCREVAEQLTSEDAFIKTFYSIYKKYQ